MLSSRTCFRMMTLLLSLVTCLPLLHAQPSDHQPTPSASTEHGDRLVAEYFAKQVKQLAQNDLTKITSAQEWLNHREVARTQLAEMLGLSPLPERTPLNATITKTMESEQFIVECLHYQSMPGLYVTANLYRPRIISGRLPAILYGCGHGKMTKDGVSLGNKTQYQHHGAWFARNGYVCLVIDTVQLGEIEGEHHGTYRLGRWWWNQRGYTPAGVETWNCMRALDYLQSRPEVDPDRIGMTGRSGGGAYSWWTAAMDDRIKVAVPVAGITTLQNHIVDGCVEGHCDCMYMVNHHRWDFPQLAALVAPRPLLISNTDKDTIFPLDGVVELHRQVRHLYRMLQADDHLGLQITEGPHKDSQELQIHAMSWFNRFLKHEDPIIDTQATTFFAPEQLKVFERLPEDEITSKIDATFVPQARNRDITDWKQASAQASNLSEQLTAWTFRNWQSNAEATEQPTQAVLLGSRGTHLLYWLSFASESPYQLDAYWVVPDTVSNQSTTRIEIANEARWSRWSKAIAVVAPQRVPTTAASTKIWDALVAEHPDGVNAIVLPRGVGPTAWTKDEKKSTHIRRRFMLLGKTVAAEQVWDAVRGIEAIRHTLRDQVTGPIELIGDQDAAYVTLHASLFVPEVRSLQLNQLAAEHRGGPDMLHVSRLSTLVDTVLCTASRMEHLQLTGDEANLSVWQAQLQSMPWTRDRIAVGK